MDPLKCYNDNFIIRIVILDKILDFSFEWIVSMINMILKFLDDQLEVKVYINKSELAFE